MATPASQTDLDVVGTGNWRPFKLPLEQVFAAADAWRVQLQGLEKPWLCWNVSHRWCVLQQKLVKEVGWTPVVGFDPRVGPPPVIPGAVLIDFNREIQFGVMWPHFPLEFAFRFVDKLAFWHADLLCRLPVMKHLAGVFESLHDGEMAAVLDRGGRRNWLRFRSHRFWELCGCTTKSASENQFYNGTGWWRNFALHPKCVLEVERARRKRYSYDSGVGIMYWKTHYNGIVHSIPINLIKEGHCSEIGNPKYKALSSHTSVQRNLGGELDLNYSLDGVAARLGIAHLI